MSKERAKIPLQSQNSFSSIDFAISHTANVERTALPAPPVVCFFDFVVVAASFAYSFNLIECVFEIPVIKPENLDYAFN